jgi:hypothetical protein
VCVVAGYREQKIIPSDSYLERRGVLSRSSTAHYLRM